MSSSHYDTGWGPSHQHLPPPRERHLWLKVGAFGSFALLLGGSIFGPRWFWLLALAALLLLLPTAHARWLRPRVSRSDEEELVTREVGLRPSEAVRERARLLGGGAFLGVCRGRWALADPEHAVLVLGPPRSGKTSAVVIPSLLCAPGAAVSTSTKPDVLRATLRCRSELGQAWLFDPAGAQESWRVEVRRLCWSPVAAAGTWDGALLTARAMAFAAGAGRGTANEQHWRERSTALLAPLLYAASLTERPVSEVLRWVLRHELDPAGKALESEGADVAGDVLLGIVKTDERERSSIFSAAAGVLSAYNADAPRASAAHPNFDAERFVASTDTVYITAPAHHQALVAPLIVGLLEQIRHAVYRRAESSAAGAPVLWCLDELANIAPIHDLPSLVSEAGGQRLHILACLQDLSQARSRWGAAADGFLSLFQTKLILGGVADSRTLEAVSLVLGEYDRHLISHTLGRSRPHELFAPHTDSESVTYSTHRQRTLSPGEIHRLPPGHALLLHSSQWGLTRLAPAHRCEPWVSLAG